MSAAEAVDGDAASRPESSRRRGPLPLAASVAAGTPAWREAVAGLEAADRALEDARAAVAAASDARAVAVYRARVAGMGLRDIGAVIGTAHPNVPALERRGAELAARPPAPTALPVSAASPVAAPASGRESRRLAAPIPGRRCLREGCPFPAADGARFCTPHRWS